MPTGAALRAHSQDIACCSIAYTQSRKMSTYLSTDDALPLSVCGPEGMDHLIREVLFREARSLAFEGAAPDLQKNPQGTQREGLMIALLVF